MHPALFLGIFYVIIFTECNELKIRNHHLAPQKGVRPRILPLVDEDVKPVDPLELEEYVDSIVEGTAAELKTPHAPSPDHIPSASEENELQKIVDETETQTVREEEIREIAPDQLLTTVETENSRGELVQRVRTTHNLSTPSSTLEKYRSLQQ